MRPSVHSYENRRIPGEAELYLHFRGADIGHVNSAGDMHSLSEPRAVRVRRDLRPEDRTPGRFRRARYDLAASASMVSGDRDVIEGA